MGLVSKLAVPLLSAGLVFGGCSRNDSSLDSDVSSEMVSQGESSGSSLKNRWWEKEPKGQENYVEDFAGLNMKMIWIPGGNVMYDLHGSSKFVDGFWIGESEISVNQWLKFLEVSRYDPSKESLSRCTLSSQELRQSNLPMRSLSVKNVEHMANYLTARTGRNYSLPYLSEWVLACRGPDVPREGYLGRVTPENANIKWDKSSTLLPVRSLKPNLYGLYDMIGNIGEYTILDQDPSEIRSGHGRGNSGRAWDGRIFVVSPSAWTSEDVFKKDYSGDDDLFKIIRSSEWKVGYIDDDHVGFRLVSRPDND